jgi:hypothetical protein
MNINFNVLRSCMKDRICCEVRCSNIITPKGGWCGREDAEFREKGLEPNNFCCSLSNSTILGFCTRARDRALFSRGPREKISTKIKTIASGGPSIIETTSPISIRKCLNSEGCLTVKKKAVVDCVFEIT